LLKKKIQAEKIPEQSAKKNRRIPGPTALSAKKGTRRQPEITPKKGPRRVPLATPSTPPKKPTPEKIMTPKPDEVDSADEDDNCIISNANIY
jgi:hypothetical protein